jgi:DnaK suppressor protein
MSSGNWARKNKYMEKRFQGAGKGEGRTSTSAEILGSNGKVEPRLREYFDRLMNMRQSLLDRRGQLGTLSPVEEANHNVNLADRASDEYDNGAMFGQFSTDQDAIFEIDEALRRIANGTYGICEVTGKPIPEDRLKAIPWTRFSKEVEEQIEREDQAHRPRHVL